MGDDRWRQRVVAAAAAAAAARIGRLLEGGQTAARGFDHRATHLAVVWRVPGHAHAPAPTRHAHSHAAGLLRLLNVVCRAVGARQAVGLQAGALGAAGRRPAFSHGASAAGLRDQMQSKFDEGWSEQVK